MDELRQLREEIAFLQAEQKVCCQSTPGAAVKRPRIEAPDALPPQEMSSLNDKGEKDCPNRQLLLSEPKLQAAVTPTPITALSLIQEEESELEGDSPFERKLKLYEALVLYCRPVTYIFHSTHAAYIGQ